MTALRFLAFALLLGGCGAATTVDAPPRAAAGEEGAEPPMPTGNGTKRALVLVDGDTAPSPPPVPTNDALTTRKIVLKVITEGAAR